MIGRFRIEDAIWAFLVAKNVQIVAAFVMLERLRASYIDLLIV